MLVSLEASTATQVCANRFIPSVFDVIRFLSGAMSLYQNVVFNIYGTALFVSNKAEYGGEIQEKKEKQVPIRFFDLSRGFGIRHDRIWPLMGRATIAALFPHTKVCRGSNYTRKSSRQVCLAVCLVWTSSLCRKGFFTRSSQRGPCVAILRL